MRFDKMFDLTLGRLLAELATYGRNPIHENWKRTHQWDADHSNTAGIIESDPNRPALERAIELKSEAKEAMFPIWKELAENGSAFAMNEVAWHYLAGKGVEQNRAMAIHWYRSAERSGSQWAAVRLAKLLAEQDDYTGVEKVLTPQVASGWAPAKFWLAWYRLQSSQARAQLDSARELLEEAMDEGHPGAKWYLGRLMAQGRFGWKNRSHGRKILMDLSPEIISEIEAPPKPD
tara:strand:+ start:1796 stop:2494 length:699 start_codon:yes stop_codon:yes gene_type:complete